MGGSSRNGVVTVTPPHDILDSKVCSGTRLVQEKLLLSRVLVLQVLIRGAVIGSAVRSYTIVCPNGRRAGVILSYEARSRDFPSNLRLPRLIGYLHRELPCWRKTKTTCEGHSAGSGGNGITGSWKYCGKDRERALRRPLRRRRP